ncbi:MAG: hypothetical protein NTY38_02610 [Acidobacteria bacterium]|nr:hypothetical protein [Acidobacteriota bacterium]
MNTMFMRFFTGCFGLSLYTLRAGALVGAAFYVGACYRMAIVLLENNWHRWALFLCLTLNPFVQDYLSVARGYSLGLGFLMTAVAIAVEEFSEAEPDFERPIRRCTFMSAFMGLSFCGNFTFAYMNATLMLLYIALAEKAWRVKLAVHAVLPGAAVTLVLCGSTLLNWQRSELYYGSSSVREMIRSVRDSTMYELNPYVVNPLLLRPLEIAGRFLPAIYGAVSLLLLAGVTWAIFRRDEGVKARSRTYVYLAGSMMAAFAMYWVAFKVFHVLLPKERTGVFFVPISILAFGAGIAANRIRAARVAGGLVLVLGAIYFCGCLRLSHTREWKFDADVATMYDVLRNLKRPDGGHAVTVNWEFHRALEGYAVVFREQARFEFQGYEGGPPPAGKAVYVLPEGHFRDLNGREKLEVVYRGEMTGNVVAITAAQQGEKK